MNYKNFIEGYKEEALSILAKLISFNTVLDEYKENSEAPFGVGNKECLEYLLSKASEDGFDVLNVDNYAGHIEFGSGDETLGILAHLDVVPVVESEWESYPFSLSFRDGKMFARGVLDDKGPLVCAYIAMKILLDNGFKPSKRIRLIAGCDEESGSRCLEHYFSKVEKPTIGFSPDACFPLIFGEKGMMSYDILSDSGDNVISTFVCGERYNIVPSYAKMTIKCDLKKEFSEYLTKNGFDGGVDGDTYYVNGVAAHAMCPENGLNAAYILFDFLNIYSDSKAARFMAKYFVGDVYGEKLSYDVSDEEMGVLTSNFALVRIDESSMRLGVNCRIPLDEHFEVIEKCLMNATKEFGYTYSIISTSPRHYVSCDSPLVKTLMGAYQRATGDYESKPISIGGGTYAREMECAVAFGPVMVGREDVCHIANEYMYLEDFFKSIEIYLDAIYEVCK